MLMLTQTYTDKLVIIECGAAGCGCTFGMTQTMYNRRCEDHRPFWCPNGHERYFSGKSEAEKLKEKLDLAEDRNRSLGSVIDRQRDTIKGRDYIIRAQKAAKTRIKNRIHNGVCPCCNRTLQNLARHMESQHPEFVKT